jgi:predicted glycogen debranching enzyme
MAIDFGREICANLDAAMRREWLVTSGTGSYASGTVAGILSRCYHGLLVAALKPPLGRTLLVSKFDETCIWGGRKWQLHANRWTDGVNPDGYVHLERFFLDGTTPVWWYACADALIEKRLWMEPGADTTYVRYTLLRGDGPVHLSCKALVNYRDYHGRTRADGWRMTLKRTANGVQVEAFEGARRFYLASDRATAELVDRWYYAFALAAERERGLVDIEDNLHAATFEGELLPDRSLTLVASLNAEVSTDSDAAFARRQAHEAALLANFTATGVAAQQAPGWIRQLVLAADQFVVARPLPDEADGRTVLAGYHWFSDWGRDTMIALPGLTLATGRPAVAKAILRTFARHVDRGMLPNCFPDDGSPPSEAEYNTVDAALWYCEAVRQYTEATGDLDLVAELFAVLAGIVDWHQRGTRFGIRVDPADGLITAGEPGSQLTWMDARVGDWVVTPRIGKPIEINALWYNALITLATFAGQLGKPAAEYEDLARLVRVGFGRFWSNELGHCFDVLDGPDGNDPALRPNQIFAVSLPASPLTPERQRRVVKVCGRFLLAGCALRSLAPEDPHYVGHYGGDQRRRDGAYHRGTAWGWLLGPFVLAHRRVYDDPARAASFLAPIAHHLQDAGLGSISEIFDGDPPFVPRGCIAQAWSVAEVLRAWTATRL